MFRLFLLLLTLGISACDKPLTALEKVQMKDELVVATRFAATTYYSGADGSTGLEYDMARLFANELGVNLRLRVASSFSDILPWVTNGEADLAAAGLTITKERQKYIRFGPSYQTVRAQLVRRLNHSTPSNLGELKGHLEIVANSSHEEYLQVAQQKYSQLSWVENYDLESEGLLYLVAESLIDYTVADSNEVRINRRLYPQLKIAFDISPAEPLAWAFPKTDDLSLYNRAETFFARIKQDGTLNRLMDRYYGHISDFDYVNTSTFLNHIRSRLPKYQGWFIENAEALGIDWRLLAAIGYQESHWNPRAVSPTGVRGIMMLTRATMRQLKLKNRTDPKLSIYGGSKYFDMTKAKIPERIPEPDRTWLALAAYNIGYGHLEDARRLTQAGSGDPDKWLDVRKYLPLLSQSRWHSRTRHGYARGQEAVKYVANVRGYYDILLWVSQRDEGMARKLYAEM